LPKIKIVIDDGNKKELILSKYKIFLQFEYEKIKKQINVLQKYKKLHCYSK
jgi:hypothetical protein